MRINHYLYTQRYTDIFVSIVYYCIVNLSVCIPETSTPQATTTETTVTTEEATTFTVSANSTTSRPGYHVILWVVIGMHRPNVWHHCSQLVTYSTKSISKQVSDL